MQKFYFLKSLISSVKTPQIHSILLFVFCAFLMGPGELFSQAIQIPVQLHVVRDSDGNSDIGIAEAQTALANVNEIYFSNAPVGNKVWFKECAPAVYHDDTDLYEFSVDATFKEDQNKLLGFDTPDLVNIYFFDTITFYDYSYGGYCMFPGQFDHILFDEDYIHQPYLLAHEMGHFFSLKHPHDQTYGKAVASGADCKVTGDGVCDTPADPNLIGNGYGCGYNMPDLDPTGKNYNPAPLVNNIMSYSYYLCQTSLTNGQYERFYNSALTERPNISLNCGLGCANTFDPISAFSTSCNYAEKGQVISLTNLSANCPDGFSWTFAEAIGTQLPLLASNLENPTVTFDTYGPKKITLTVSKNGFADAVFSKTINIVRQDPLPVACTPPSNSGLHPDDNGIVQVKIGELNHYSQGFLLEGVYTDFSCIAPTAYLEVGEPHHFVVNTGQYLRIKIWIDLNNNGNFSDPGELIFQDADLEDTIFLSKHQGTIQIPSTATLNTDLRMRVMAERKDWTDFPILNDPCHKPDWGQVEDYRIHLTDRTLFETRIGDGGDDISSGIDVVRNYATNALEGFVLAGQSEAYDAQYARSVLTKTNLDGTLAWTKSFGTEGDEGIIDVRQTSDGGFIVAGFLHPDDVAIDSKETNGFVMKTDANGIPEWRNEMGDASLNGRTEDQVWSVAEAENGTFVYAGFGVADVSTGYKNVLVGKLDANGQELWTRHIDRPNDSEIATSIIVTSDGNYLITGLALSLNATATGLKTDVFVTKINKTGDVVLWSKDYGKENQYAWGMGAVEISGNYYISCKARYSIGVQEFSFLLKIDGNGNTQFATRYKVPAGEKLNAYRLVVVDNTIMMVAVHQTSAGSNALLLNLDETGKVLSNKAFGAAVNDVGYGIVTTENLLAFIGTSNTFSDQEQMYLVATDLDGTGSCDEQNATIIEQDFDNIVASDDLGFSLVNFPHIGGAFLPLATAESPSQQFGCTVQSGGRKTASAESVESYFGNSIHLAETVEMPAISARLFPNPANSSFSISLANLNQDKIQLNVIDITGRIVHQEQRNATGQTQEIRLNALELSSGMYSVAIVQGNRKTHLKLVVNR